jgi:hypothetical protein
MGYIRNDILAAAGQHDIPLVERSAQAYHEMLLTLQQKFTQCQPGRVIWENLIAPCSRHNATAWRWLGDFVGATPTILLTTEYVHEPILVDIATRAEIVVLLGETTNFEFYLTNSTTDYLLCFNHHDYLIASGMALPWLQQRVENAR